MKLKLTLAEDTLCKGCPNSNENKTTCNLKFINKIDLAVKSLLGLEEGKIYKYDELSNKLSDVLDEQKHKEICGDCGWRAQGLCADTFKKAIE